MTIQVSELMPEGSISDMQSFSNFAAIADRTKFTSHVLALYLSKNLRSTNASVAEIQTEIQTAARARLENLKFPTTKDEEWRFTNLSELAKLSLVRDENKPEGNLLIESLVSGALIPEATEGLIVFVNGAYSSQYSRVRNLENGVVIGTLGTIPEDRTEMLKSYFAQHPDTQDYFSTLNTACLADSIQDVAIVFVPKGVKIESPIQLLFVTENGMQSIISQPRCLVVAEAHSSVKLVETYLGGDSNENPQPYFTNAVTEIWLGEAAQVHHTKVQKEGKSAFIVANTAIAQSRYSIYKGNAISFGAKVSRHNLHVRQMGEQTETHLNGLALIDGHRLADTHSCMSHDFPHGSSNQLHKCIAGDRAHTVFNGKIQVAKVAQLTDSRQLSRNLSLSPQARIDTKPQLEIFADNVKCAHGATVSQLDADEIFYLQSRGIDSASSAKLLTYGFAAEVIDRIAIASLQASLSKSVLEHLS